MISISEIEAGVNTPFWKEIVKQLEEQLVLNHRELEDPDNSMTIEQFKRHGGVVEAIRRFLDLPELMKEEYLMEIEDNKQAKGE